jgi:predicted permease
VAAMSEYLTEQYASIQRGRTFFVTPIWRSPVGAQPLLRPVLLALSGLAVLLLLLACANVTNLLLARALQRRRDLAIRLALGSGRLRAVRQFLAEGCLLAGAGGIGGVVLTMWAIGLLKLFPPPGPIAGGFDAEVDWAVLRLTTLLVVGVAMLIGLIPAIQSLRAAPMSVLRSESGFLTAGQARRRAGNLFAALQIAVCIAVLVGAGLSLRSLDRSRQLDLGFPADDILLASYNLFLSGYDEEAGVAFHRQILRRLSAVPAVSSASIASAVPFALSGQTVLPVDLAGYTPRSGEDTLLRSNVVAPDYFRTMAIPIVRGRAFEERDDRQSPLVTIVSQTVANRYWPDREPVGQTIRFPTGERLEVVGVVADVRYDARRNEPPVFYVPLFQWYRPDVTLHFRTASAASARVIADVRRMFRSIDPSVPVFNTTMLEAQVRSSVFFERFAASLSTLLAIVCLALTAIGVYSLLAYAVTERTVEIGLRVVLGAQRRDVVRIVLHQALLVMVTGVVFGTLGGLATAYLLASMLVGVDPADGMTWAASLFAVTIIVIVATAIAASRATRIGATAALRATD